MIFETKLENIENSTNPSTIDNLETYQNYHESLASSFVIHIPSQVLQGSVLKNKQLTTRLREMTSSRSAYIHQTDIWRIQ